MNKDIQDVVGKYLSGERKSPTLDATINNVVNARDGFISLDHIAQIIETWLTHSNGKEMTYAEYVAACKEQE